MNRCKTCRFWKGKIVYQNSKECINTGKKVITAITRDQYGIGTEYTADFLYTQPTFGCTEHKESL
jgi:hypothetical protein